MRLTRDTFEPSAFVIREEDIKKLVEYLETTFSNVELRIDCSDKLSRELSLDELLKYENLRSKQIETLVIDSGYRGPSKARVRIMKSGHFAVALSGEYDVVSRANEVLNGWVEGVRPWYWRAVRMLKVSTTLGWLLPVVVVGILLTVIQGYFSRNEVLADLQGVAFWLPYLAVLFAVGGLFNYFYDKAFPAGEFAIGQGLKRYRRRETFRQVVLGGLLVTIVGAVILSFFQRTPMGAS